MTADELKLLDLLRACASAAPLFPSQHVDPTLDRADLDAALDRLRNLGLIQIADWVQGKGQGYAVTPAGLEALETRTLNTARAPDPEPGDVAEPSIIEAAVSLEPRRPAVTIALLSANLSVFIVGLALAVHREIPVNDYFGGGRGNIGVSELKMDLGSLYPPSVLRFHEYWRLLTYQFVHGDFLHLLVNMLCLFSLGPILETVWGPRRFLTLYLLAGWFGGCAALLSLGNTVGASGAIAGLLTSLGTWIWLNRHRLPEQLVASWSRSIGINVLLLIMISTVPNVSWQAHLGGAVGGILVSVPLHFLAISRGPRFLLALAGLVLLPLAALLIALAPNRETTLAHWRFRAEINSTESWLIKQHNEYAVPLMRRGSAAWLEQPEFLPNAQAACTEAEAKLQPLLTHLSSVNPPEDSVIAEELHKTHAYFQSWADFFQAMGKSLTQPERWHDGRRRELARLRDIVLERHTTMEHLTIMPALNPLVKDTPDPPEQQSAPPNTAGLTASR